MKRKTVHLLQRIAIVVTTVLFGLTAVGSVIAFENASFISGELGAKTYEIVVDENAANEDTEYFKSDYGTLKEMIQAGKEMTTEAMAEGAILLINENNALPLKEGARKISVFGITSADPVYSGTGSGKTTFLGALSRFIPSDERIISIEDNAELKIEGIANLVRLEAKMANLSGSSAITIRDLIRASLRMRPDRIIVGEVRGGETLDMLQSLNTGHDGSLSTGHGNSPRDMLSRLEVMTLMAMDLPISAVRRQIASGIDLMVHLGRLRDRTRKVLEILEIDGYDLGSGEIMTHTIYRFQEEGEDEKGKILGKMERCGTIRHTGKLERAGIALAELFCGEDAT